MIIEIPTKYYKGGVFSKVKVKSRHETMISDEPKFVENVFDKIHKNFQYKCQIRAKKSQIRDNSVHSCHFVYVNSSKTKSDWKY